MYFLGLGDLLTADWSLNDRSAQKTIDREVSHVQSAVSDVEKALKSSNGDLANLPALLAVVEERLGSYLVLFNK